MKKQKRKEKPLQWLDSLKRGVWFVVQSLVVWGIWAAILLGIVFGIARISAP
jgi:hypothetical protein